MKVSVIGGGTMGNGIAQVFAQCGHDVNLIDVKQEFLDRALGTIEKNLGRMVKKEKILSQIQLAWILIQVLEQLNIGFIEITYLKTKSL